MWFFKRNLSADRLNKALAVLKKIGSVESRIEKTSGRDAERFFASANELDEIDELSLAKSLHMKTKLTQSQINQFLATAETVDAKLSTAAIGLGIIHCKAIDVGLSMNELVEFLAAQGYSRVAEALRNLDSNAFAATV